MRAIASLEGVPPHQRKPARFSHAIRPGRTVIRGSFHSHRSRMPGEIV